MDARQLATPSATYSMRCKCSHRTVQPILHSQPGHVPVRVCHRQRIQLQAVASHIQPADHAHSKRNRQELAQIAQGCWNGNLEDLDKLFPRRERSAPVAPRGRATLLWTRVRWHMHQQALALLLVKKIIVAWQAHHRPLPLALVVLRRPGHLRCQLQAISLSS